MTPTREKNGHTHTSFLFTHQHPTSGNPRTSLFTSITVGRPAHVETIWTGRSFSYLHILRIRNLFHIFAPNEKASVIATCPEPSRDAPGALFFHSPQKSPTIERNSQNDKSLVRITKLALRRKETTKNVNHTTNPKPRRDVAVHKVRF